MTYIYDKYKLYSYQDEIISNGIEGHTRWIAKLDNGLEIFQDDFRQYDFEDDRRYSTWSRLRDFCYKEDLSIVNLRLQFRTNVQNLPTNSEGYYFCKSILGVFGTIENLHFFVAGYVMNDVLRVSKWQIPELICIENQIREIRKDDVCLILGRNFR